MFELNLIKDKALARQRRRVIFLSIVTIVFLAALCSIFVGSLIYREMTAIEKRTNEIASKKTESDNLKNVLDVREPKAIARRAGMIRAYNEDVDTLDRKPDLTPILEALAENYPASSEFWYTDLQISLDNSAITDSDDQYSLSRELLRSRVLQGTGYVEIEGSDVVTTMSLNAVADSMFGVPQFRNLLSTPKFNLDLQNERTAGPGDANKRYVPFTIQAQRDRYQAKGRE